MIHKNLTHPLPQVELTSFHCAMKTLLILRHAKAEDAAPGQSDFERVLKDRGRDQARAIGLFIKERMLNIDLLLCSTAARAKETAEIVMVAATSNADRRTEAQLYEASSLQLFDLIVNLSDSASALLIVGHNPGLEDLVHLLSDRTCQLETCSLARIEIDADSWGDLAEVSGKLDWVVNSQDLLDE
ncbi:MAG TPA: histidine phosphatase family protein [Pyrinomonadaceae bacterium]|nr:histidine phosphatase family protein [Pyrinomonadaceae bacterium]